MSRLTGEEIHAVGVHYDQNVIGNWNAPAPGVTPLEIRVVNPDGAPGALHDRVTAAELNQPENLLAPRSFHFTAAYEREISGAVSVGVQYVHKYADRLVGWSILGRRYETVPWTDPWSGTPLSPLNEIEPPKLVKGNTPGDFPGAPEKYERTHDGLVFSFTARDAGRLNVQGSYTWSRSAGLISRPWSQSQNSPSTEARWARTRTRGSEPGSDSRVTGRTCSDCRASPSCRGTSWWR